MKVGRGGAGSPNAPRTGDAPAKWCAGAKPGSMPGKPHKQGVAQGAARPLAEGRHTAREDGGVLPRTSCA